MAYKLSISNQLIVIVKAVLADGAKDKRITFELVCDRIGLEDYLEMFKPEENESPIKKLKEFVIYVTTGWNDQTLVTNQDGTKADFCPEALEALLDVPGMTNAAFNAYQKQWGDKTKN